MELINIPSRIVAGSKVLWTTTLDDYSAALWTLRFHIRGAAALDVLATTNADGSSFDLALVAAYGITPTPLPAGQYFWQSYVTSVSDATDKRLVSSGRLEILTDLSDPNLVNFDGRTVNEITYAAIKAMVAGKATKDQQSYTIGQRTLSRIPLDQLISLEKHYASLVTLDRARTRAENGGDFFETVKVTFQEPK